MLALFLSCVAVAKLNLEKKIACLKPVSRALFLPLRTFPPAEAVKLCARMLSRVGKCLEQRRANTK